jgi:hypothetical protein
VVACTIVVGLGCRSFLLRSPFLPLARHAAAFVTVVAVVLSATLAVIIL